MKVTAVVTRLVRHTMLAAPLALAPALSSVLLQAVGVDVSWGKAFAQDDEEAKPQYKTRKTPALREAVFKKLSVVQALTNPEPEQEGGKAPPPDFQQALVELGKIDTSKFNEYELAQVYNYYGFIYYSLEDYPKAIKNYRLVAAQAPNIPVGLEVGTLYTIAQLQFITEDYKGAIDTLKQWMKVAPIIGADAYMLMAQGYYQINDMDEALKNTNTAIDMYESKGKIPKENWYSLQRAIYYDKGNNKKVVEILEKMVRHYPKGTYYKQLAGMYGLVERDRDQIYMMDAAYVLGVVVKEKELMNLAYMFMAEQYPYRAAKIIEKGMKEKRIERTSKNLEVLASAWRLSQEVDKSIPVLAEAAGKSDKGDLYARLAGLYLDSDKYNEALDTADKAFKKGAIKRPDQLYIVVGMANANLKNYGSCMKAMKKATKDKRSRKFASNWMNYCEAEQRREKELASS